MFSVSALVSPRQVQAPSAAFMVGHAYGLHGIALRMPITFDEAEQIDFRDGWSAGDCERRSRIVDHGDEWCSPGPTASDDGDYAAMRAAEVRPDGECPDYLALLETNDEYYSRLAAEDEPDEWTMEEWRRDRGIVRGRCVEAA